MHAIMPHFRHGGTLGSQSARKKAWISIHDQGNRFMRLKTAAFRAAGTLGSHSVRNETCSCEKTAASSRCKHNWISLAI